MSYLLEFRMWLIVVWGSFMFLLFVIEFGLVMFFVILFFVVDIVRGSFSIEFVEFCEWFWFWVFFNFNICWRENLMLECDGIVLVFFCFFFCIFIRLFNCCVINDVCDIDVVLIFLKLIIFWWDVLGLYELLEIVLDGLEFWFIVILFFVILEFVCCVFIGDCLFFWCCLDFFFFEIVMIMFWFEVVLFMVFSFWFVIVLIMVFEEDGRMKGVEERYDIVFVVVIWFVFFLLLIFFCVILVFILVFIFGFVFIFLFMFMMWLL